MNFCSVFVGYGIVFDIIFNIFSFFDENILVYKFFFVEFLYSFVSIVVVFENGVSIFFFEINVMNFVEGF